MPASSDPANKRLTNAHRTRIEAEYRQVMSAFDEALARPSAPNYVALGRAIDALMRAAAAVLLAITPGH